MSDEAESDSASSKTMVAAKVESRTTKTLRNARVALVFYFLRLGVGFFSRKIFIEYLGAELLGLNTTAVNLLSFLNLAELGIASAVAALLYKPLATGDREKINDIVAVEGWFYRKVALVVLIGAVILGLFFPLIFEKTELPLIYPYATFSVLLFGALANYFFNYRQILLTADQKNYKVIRVTNGLYIGKSLLQIAAMSNFENGYAWWLGIEFVSSVFTVVLLNYVIKKEYPWLNLKVSRGNELRKKYPEILKKTAQTFFHVFGGFVLHQASPFVIYTFTSLTVVAIYGNYLLIFGGITLLFETIFNSMTAGVGNLLAEGNHSKTKEFFWELTSVRYWIAGAVMFPTACLATSFICLWVGYEYVLDDISFALLLAYSFIRLTRTNETFTAAMGLFQDIGAPIAESVLNLGCSIALGYFWGLPGLLGGILISQIVVIVCWKPYFLFTRGFKESPLEYVRRRSCLLIVTLASATGSWFLLHQLLSFDAKTWFDWVFNASVTTVVYAVISLCFFLVLFPFFRKFIARFSSRWLQKFRTKV